MAGPRHMRDVLLRAAPHAMERGWFEPRVLFRKRVGRAIIFPLGIGSALEKAVRAGYIKPVMEKTGRNRRYAFTAAGDAYVRTLQEGKPLGRYERP